MAYVLGFFFADGSYDINPRGSEYFSLQITDKELLYTIRTALSSDHKIAIRLPRKPNEVVQYRLQIGSKDMCADLRALGISVAKAATMRFPDVPGKYLGHFIRGYFDGDGHVWSGVVHKERTTQHPVLFTGFTSCSEVFLQELYKILNTYGVIGGGIYCQKTFFRIQYSTSDSLHLYEIMYKDMDINDLYLQRKKSIFEQFKNN